jgi:hypothetical protein
VPEKNIPFYAYWASRFLAFRHKETGSDVSIAVAEFLQSLKGDQITADWQIKQAEDAVRLYLAHFKGEVKPESTRAESVDGDVFDTDHLIAETKRLIRLEHYSYSTERTYIDWINRFFQYMRETNGAPVDRPNPGDIKNYLTHLAIKKRVSSSTQNQAFNALLFLFRDILKVDIGDISWVTRASRRP